MPTKQPKHRLEWLALALAVAVVVLFSLHGHREACAAEQRGSSSTVATGVMIMDATVTKDGKVIARSRAVVEGGMAPCVARIDKLRAIVENNPGLVIARSVCAVPRGSSQMPRDEFERLKADPWQGENPFPTN
jgi:hypothetical protein